MEHTSCKKMNSYSLLHKSDLQVKFWTTGPQTHNIIIRIRCIITAFVPKLKIIRVHVGNISVICQTTDNTIQPFTNLIIHIDAATKELIVIKTSLNINVLN